jgi:hypothetical protein
MPPPDSLLFSANPETHPLIPDNALAWSFHSSAYYMNPPAGTWGNTPWGMSYEDSLNRPLSPCIFDYRRAGSAPLYLPDPINTIRTTDHQAPTPPPSKPIQNFGYENLTQFFEENLPSAVYHNDNPLHIFEPTIQMVDQYHLDREYREQTCHNLGHSG